MAHVKSITLQIDGKWHNIPSVVGGKQLSDEAAKAHAIKQGSIGRSYSTMERAVRAAKARGGMYRPPKPNPLRLGILKG